jgi:hypothetical protein
MTETGDFGGQAPEPRRRRYVVLAAIAVILVLLGGAAVGIKGGWFGDDPPAAGGLAHPLPSTPRAFTAAVLAHVPAGVTVIWSNGEGGLPDDNPSDDQPGDFFTHTLFCGVLLRQGSREVSLSLTASQPEGPVPGFIADGIFKRDNAGNVISEMMIGESGVTVLEEVQIPSTTPLPLTTKDLQALVNDPRVGIQTDAATLARSKHIRSYVDPAPGTSWGEDE